jgi:hypothetical protein
VIIFPYQSNTQATAPAVEYMFDPLLGAGPGPGGTITVRPTKLQANRSALQRIFVTLSTATWSGSTTFTLSGVSGVTKVATNVDSPTQAFIAITTTGSAIGTLTISDGTNTGTTLITPIAPTRRRWFPGLDRRRRFEDFLE